MAKNQKGIVQFVLILAVAVVGLFLVGYNLYKNGKILTYSTTQQPTTPSNETVSDMSSWKTYTDKTYNFTLKYPPNWTYQDICEGGGSNESYPCFQSPDLEIGAAGVVYGPISGGEIIILIDKDNNNRNLCPKNYEGYSFPCEEATINKIKGWRSIIEGTKDHGTYPISNNTIQFTFVHDGYFYKITGYFHNDAKEQTIEVFDQILSTFEFTN